MDGERRFRVEYRGAGRTDVIGWMVGAFPHHSTLDPFVSRLLRDGADGEVCLVDDDADTVVAHRGIRPYRSKSVDRFAHVCDHLWHPARRALILDGDSPEASMERPVELPVEVRAIRAPKARRSPQS
jgi:hypothetical protein